MKPCHFIFSVILLSSINSYAQNTFPATGNVGIVTGAHNDSFGGLVLGYFDPTAGQTGTRNNNDYSGLYGVGAVGSHP